ncbi:MAG: adenylosuccinate lyase [Candidatus Omnitrophica bacterium CG11_big_fil_rev_8_21_14_0_20_42_13]|uniref:Adenylosuccinate lyase n=1 Tax=Candidatus Ghiorseimicrobium undicola TaxID=1974746 RepID=A0A2H0LZC4_9BACT|nr:MAG: adenylosuccinate lyase [Candidatus Omnitrophica bacterium CG11_big_fil_rev_8_21_14_0_20_42_13]
MIARYSRPEISQIWSESNKFSKMLEIELLAMEAQVKLGKVPRSALAQVRKKAKFNTGNIKRIEEKTQHDVVAFITEVSRHIGKNASYFHIGLTSSDVLDTALSLQCREALDIIISGLDKLEKALLRKVKRYKNSVCIGRTHGIHAEPTTFGLKAASWYTETLRAKKLLFAARETVSFAKISGAVGTYSNIDPFVEKHVASRLNLNIEPVSTQIIPRDRYAVCLSNLAVLAAGLERIALEIRHLQRTEVLEAEEPFSKGQKGSSAMPHKRNPVVCERICGLSRIIRTNALAGLENVAVWHERDISHSSVERIILPDSTILLDYMLAKMAEVVDGLIVYPDNMLKNLVKTRGLIFSQRVLTMLMDKGLKRMSAYEIVQRNAMKTWQELSNFQDNLLADRQLRKIASKKEIKACFDLDYYLRNINIIFKRLGI